MPLLLLIVALAGWCLHDYWTRLGDETWQRVYRRWFLQGACFPALIWGVVNLGFGNGFPALVPQIVEAQRAHSPWLRLWAAYWLAGTLVVIIHWVAISYVWLTARIAAGTRERKDFWFTALFFSVFTVTIAGLLIRHYGWSYLAWVLVPVLLPIVHFTVELAEHRPIVLTYSRALGQLKFGKYKQAELEVISQLEKSQNDFEGWMLLAELYARQYRNLEDAARVVFDVCNDPETRPHEVSMACDRLADWQLEIGANPLAARAALELMIRKLPGTHFARMAEQRLRQVPRSVDAFDESRKVRTIRLPPLSEAVSQPRPETISRSEAAAEANRLSARLEEDPNDLLTRHKLALVLAEKLGKVDLAVEQLQLLIQLEDPTDEQKAVWSAEIAKWEYHQDRDSEKLGRTLRALIRTYPQTTQAFAAQRQLMLLEYDAQDANGHPLRPTSPGTA